MAIVKRTGHRWRKLRRQVIAEETHCCRCGHAVDKTLQFPHPMSPSVDHLDPLAGGGALLDRTRCRLAHYSCNSSHGSRWNAARKRPPTHQRTSRAW